MVRRTKQTARKHTAATSDAIPPVEQKFYAKRSRIPVPTKNRLEQSVEIFEEFGLSVDLSSKLGSGSFSSVYRAISTKTQRNFAVKTIDLRVVPRKLKLIENEMKVWTQLDHKFLVTLHSHYEFLSMRFAVMEYAHDGTMLDVVTENDGLTEDLGGKYMSQLLLGVQYMHSQLIAHHDIKLENVLMFGDSVKLGDFGFAQKMEASDSLSRTFVGTTCYMAPEILQHQAHNPFLADMWSLGILAMASMVNDFPFHGDSSVISALQENFDYPNPRRLVSLTDECATSICKMIKFDPEQRPTATECLELPWIRPFVPGKAEKNPQ